MISVLVSGHLLLDFFVQRLNLPNLFILVEISDPEIRVHLYTLLINSECNFRRFYGYILVLKLDLLHLFKSLPIVHNNDGPSFRLFVVDPKDLDNVAKEENDFFS